MFHSSSSITLRRVNTKTKLHISHSSFITLRRITAKTNLPVSQFQLHCTYKNHCYNRTTCFTVPAPIHLEDSILNPNYIFHSSSSITLRRINSKSKLHVSQFQLHFTDTFSILEVQMGGCRAILRLFQQYFSHIRAMRG